MQYFIKNRNEIKTEELPYLPLHDSKLKIDNYPDVVFGTKITETQYKNAKICNFVVIQRENTKYIISFNMIQKKLTHKIRSYV